jgi:hypothetical protein
MKTKHDPITVYLDWVNNYINIHTMALDYNMPVQEMLALAESGRIQHEANLRPKKWINLCDMKIDQIAVIIRHEWKNVNYAAVPYLSAMECLESVDDNYCHDSGRSIVGRFLCNASAWRGELARDIKNELKNRIQ